MIEIIDNLISKGQSFNFGNNSYITSYGIYTRASSDLLSWIATIEDFVEKNYGENSAPFKLYHRFDKEMLNGYGKEDFDKEMEILFGVLKACKTINPKKHNNIEENLIISLLKNPIFWTVSVVLIGSSFTLGKYFGSTKFDKEKISFERENVLLKKTLDSLQVNLAGVYDENESLQEKLKLHEN